MPVGGAHSGGIFEPLRHAPYRDLWIANLVSNLGWLVHSVAAAWLMTSLSGTPEMVALVQTAVQVPIVMISLLAGVAADVWDRRRVLLIALLWQASAAAMLGVLTLMGLVGPLMLLALTFVLGLGTALGGPALQAVVRDLVGPERLPAAVTLNAISFNLARTAGPALGGLLVALAGAAVAFLINAGSTLAVVAILLRWPSTMRLDDLPRERIHHAVATAFRYAVETRELQNILIRSFLFSLMAASTLALLPLVARDRLGGGPLTYGVLLGGFGLGALAGAFVIHSARQRFGSEAVVRALSLACGLALIAIGLIPRIEPVLFALAVAGAAWLGSFSNFNISVQTTSAHWIQARAFALYQTVMFSALAGGSWMWGRIAENVGVGEALVVAGGLLLVTVLASFRYRLPGEEPRDLRPQPIVSRPGPSVQFDPAEGPVLIQVEYRIALTDAAAFAAAMDDVGAMRRRNGALRWRLFQDTADAEHWVETYVVADWNDLLRQRRRSTMMDETVRSRAAAFHNGPEPPLVRRLIARREDARFPLDATERAAAEHQSAGANRASTALR
ncbi:MAG: MFS transporter [Geminicoccaceae bacterium]